MNYFRLFVLYVLATQDEAGCRIFDEALRRHGLDLEGESRHGLDPEGEITSYGEELLEQGRAEGLMEGMLRGKVGAVESLLRVGVTWDVIKAAIGLNETEFRALKDRLSAPNQPQGE